MRRERRQVKGRRIRVSKRSRRARKIRRGVIKRWKRRRN